METILILALLIEAVITTVKWLVTSQFNWERIVAIAISVLVTVLAELDIFAQAGVALTLPYVGPILTGFIVSRGANAFNDLLKSIKSFSSIVSKFPQLLPEIVEYEVVQEQEEKTGQN